MPIYPYSCPGCGAAREILVRSREEAVPCACGARMARGFGAAVGRVAPWLRDENYEGNERQRAHLRRPDVRKAIRDGRLAPAGRGED